MRQRVMRGRQDGRLPTGHTAAWICALVCLGLPGLALASETKCRTQVKSKQYQQAAQCYTGLYKQVDGHPSWSKDAPLYKDRFLRHAALCYRLSANAQTQLGVKGYLKEKAVALLRKSFKKGYCEASQRCRTNRLLADQLEQEIGYAPLTVLSNNRKTKIQVVGYKFRDTRYQNYTKKVRPGVYTLTISDPTRGSKQRKVTVRPNHSVSINATTAKIQIVEKRIIIAKKIPPLVLAGYIGGGILAAVGAALIAFAVVEQNSLNAVWRDPSKNKDLTEEEYDTRFGNAETTKIIGGVLGGLGILFLAGGAIAHIAANASTPQKRIEIRPGSPLNEAPPPARGQSLLLVAH